MFARRPRRSIPILMLTAALLACRGPVEREVRWNWLDAEATATIVATTESVVEAIAEEMRSATDRLARQVDPGDPESELSRINRQAPREPVRVASRDLYVCLSRALDYARASRGAFDPTSAPLADLYRRDPSPPPAAIARALEHVGWDRMLLLPETDAIRLRDPEMKLDLGPMLDGLALDVAVRAFSRVGSRAGLLTLRGSVQAWGEPPRARGWPVTLVDAARPESPIGVVEVDNRALGISGRVDSEGLPVLDPRTGLPPDHRVVMAVAIAEGAADAAALSRALLVGGPLGAGTLLSKTHRVEALLVVERASGNEILASASLKGRFRRGDADERTPVRFILPPDPDEMRLPL